MNSNRYYSPFVEHSFRRLTLLIHQQDVLNSTTTTTSSTKTTDQSSKTSSAVHNEFVSFSSRNKSHPQSIDTTETKIKVEPLSRTRRSYMRPPKNRTTNFSHRCSSTQLSDRSETSCNNHSVESPCSPSLTKQESNELPIHIPCEQSLYDLRFQKDRQNDVRQRYNIPSPFERKWLRQPRYIPQERPSGRHIQQSENR